MPPYKKIEQNTSTFSFDAAGIVNFYNSAKANSLTNFGVSLPLPNYTGLTDPILPIVGDNFKSTVIDPIEDVVVVFYNNSSGDNTSYSDAIIEEVSAVASCFNYQTKLKFFRFNISGNEVYDYLKIDSRLTFNHQVALFSNINGKKNPIYFDSKGQNLDISRENIRDFIKNYVFYPVAACTFP